MDDLSAILASIFSSGTFNEMLRRATPVALAAIGGSLTEHDGIMNIGMDGMILMGAFFGVFGSYLFTSAWGGVGLVLLMGLLVGLFFALFVVKFRSDEFIIGCALNTFALGLTTYLSRSVFGTSGAKGFPSSSCCGCSSTKPPTASGCAQAAKSPRRCAPPASSRKK